jgi:hypothetical protein
MHGAAAQDQVEVKPLRVVRLTVCCAAAAAAKQVLRRFTDDHDPWPQLLQRPAAWAVPLGRRWHLCHAKAGDVKAERAAVADQKRLGAYVGAAPHARCIRVDAVVVVSSCLVLHHGCWGAMRVALRWRAVRPAPRTAVCCCCGGCGALEGI